MSAPTGAADLGAAWGARVTGVILARNEEAKIGDAIRSLDWCLEVLVLDDASTDRTAEIARGLGAVVVPVGDRRPGPFDGLRNRAIDLARGDWLYYLDADERVPREMGPLLLRLIAERGSEFAAVVIPFRNYFCGKWMEHCGWWPGYCRPQLLKKGCFHYGERFHSGVDVQGRTFAFPPDPALSVEHLSYDSVEQYIAKLNAYTSGEAQALVEDGKSHGWRAQLAHLAQDWGGYYDAGRAPEDGEHGLALAGLSGFYRYVARIKAWDLRRRAGEPPVAEPPPPASFRELLIFLLRVDEEGAKAYLDRLDAEEQARRRLPPATAAEGAVVAQSLYRVAAGFPRITEGMLPVGVGDVRYSIAAAACASHAVPSHEFAACLQGADP